MSDADEKPQARGGDRDAPERISVEFNGAGFPVGTWVGGFGQDSTTYIRADLMAELVDALRALHHAVCGETGFAACVRLESGKAYPWPALDDADEAAAAALAKIKEQTK